MRPIAMAVLMAAALAPAAMAQQAGPAAPAAIDASQLLGAWRCELDTRGDGVTGQMQMTFSEGNRWASDMTLTANQAQESFVLKGRMVGGYALQGAQLRQHLEGFNVTSLTLNGQEAPADMRQSVGQSMSQAYAGAFTITTLMATQLVLDEPRSQTRCQR
jgi:uncharacterized protein YdgA (DUF945 family)